MWPFCAGFMRTWSQLFSSGSRKARNYTSIRLAVCKLRSCSLHTPQSETSAMWVTIDIRVTMPGQTQANICRHGKPCLGCHVQNPVALEPGGFKVYSLQWSCDSGQWQLLVHKWWEITCCTAMAECLVVRASFPQPKTLAIMKLALIFTQVSHSAIWFHIEILGNFFLK